MAQILSNSCIDISKGIIQVVHGAGDDGQEEEILRLQQVKRVSKRSMSRMPYFYLIAIYVVYTSCAGE